MAQRVDVPGVGIIEFPDGMSDEQMAAAIRANYPNLNQQQKAPERTAAGTAAFLPGGFNKGLADVVGMPVDLATWGSNKLLGALGQPTRDEPLPLSSDWLKGLMYDAKMIGDPATGTERALERVGREVGAAAVPVGGLLGAASTGARSSLPVIGEALQAARSAPGAFAATEAGLALSSGAGAAAANEMFPGNPPAEMIGQLTGSLAPYGAAAGIRGAFRGGQAGRQALEQNLETFSRAGMSPTAGQATNNPVSQTIETILAKSPGGGVVMRKTAQATADRLRQSVDDVAARYSPRAGPEIAGRTIERGIRDGFVNRFEDQAGKLFGRLDHFIKPASRVAVRNTRTALETMTRPIDGAESVSKLLTNPKVAQIQQAFAQDAASGAMPFRALKDLRSRVGRMLTNPQLVDDIPRAELKRLYGALSDDMRDAAKAAGPGALSAFTRANKYYKAGMSRMEDVLQKVVNRANPEDIFSAATRGKDGATVIRTARRSLEPEEWDVVASTVLRRLGDARPHMQNAAGDVFSPESFLTNWNRLSPEARSALFGGTRYKNMSRDLDAIAASISNIKDSLRTMANPSGTAELLTNLGAAQVAGYGALTGNAALPVTVAALVGTSAGGAKLLTNPKFVRWLAGSTKIPAERLPSYVARLSVALKGEDPEVREEAAAYLSQLTGEENKEPMIIPIVKGANQ